MKRIRYKTPKEIVTTASMRYVLLPTYAVIISSIPVLTQIVKKYFPTMEQNGWPFIALFWVLWSLLSFLCGYGFAVMYTRGFVRKKGQRKTIKYLFSSHCSTGRPSLFDTLLMRAAGINLPLHEIINIRNYEETTIRQQHLTWIEPLSGHIPRMIRMFKAGVFLMPRVFLRPVLIGSAIGFMGVALVKKIMPDVDIAPAWKGGGVFLGFCCLMPFLIWITLVLVPTFIVVSRKGISISGEFMPLSTIESIVIK